jgi:hypothetical protein
MPRKSSAAITTLPAVNVRHIRLQPRDDASPEIKDIFTELVRSQPPQHFRPGDGDLLEQYCQAVLLSREAYRELQLGGSVSPDGRISSWVVVLEKSHRSAAALATKLRLTPSSRLSTRTVARQKTPPRKPIWEVD